jgi:hypothetical protein
MKKTLVTTAGVLVLVIAMATSALGRQSMPEPGTISQSLPGTVARAMLEEAGSGQVAGLVGLPSTATQTTDPLPLALLGVAVALGGVVLIRKAMTDR